MRYYYTAIRKPKVKKKKKLTVPSDGEDGELSWTADGNVKWYNNFGK